METLSETKYQKLAQEYAKLRAQATVLRKAILEEQEEKATLKEQLRQQKAAQRRSEQEVDSLDFRNVQLEHRVSVLQQELAAQEGRKKDHKRSAKTEDQPIHGNAKLPMDNSSELAQDAIIFEELQKKILENVKLTSSLDEKERDVHRCAERIASLESALQKQSTEQTELEKHYRHELDALQKRNTELETKLIEAASIFGSEEALSVSEGDNTAAQHANVVAHGVSTVSNVALDAADMHNKEERIALLEKEVLHWRAQCEILKPEYDSYINNSKDTCGCSSTAAAGIMVNLTSNESQGLHARDSTAPTPTTTTTNREQQLFNHFCKKYEVLLQKTREAESIVESFKTESEHLKDCLADATEHIKVVKKKLIDIEEDLTTTRVNYEEQISVLTEQVINLSEQLAACK